MNTENINLLPELTENNHLKFGYNGEWYNQRVRLYDKFYSTYGKCTRQPGTFRQECIKVANLICDKAEEKHQLPNLFYSGGLDSEVVCEAFLATGRKFKITTLRFSQDLNKHDLDYVQAYAKLRNLEVTYVDIDILEWYASEDALDLAIKANCKYIEMTAMMWLMDQFPNDYLVMGNGDCYLFKESNDTDSRWVFKELEYIMGWYFHLLRQNKSSAPGFFQYTPELMLAFLEEPLIKDLCANKLIYKLTSRSSKYAIYAKNFSIGEARKKYSGFEYIPRKISIEQNKILSSRTFYDRQSAQSIEYNDLITLLTPL